MSRLFEFAQELSQSLDNNIRTYFNLKAGSLTTFGLGVDVPTVIEPNSIIDLQRVIEGCHRNNFEYKILGAGSNIILPDQPLSCVIIRLGTSFRSVRISHQEASFVSDFTKNSADAESWKSKVVNHGPSILLSVCGRVSIMQLSAECCRLGLSGLECAAGIPGSLSGAIKMNAGAHGWDIGSIVEDVLILNEQNMIAVIKAKDLFFDYRKSAISDQQIILGARLKMITGDSAQLQKKRADLLKFRRKTQPITFPSAGSVFKNPNASTKESDSESNLPSAGLLLDNVGLKGFRIGGVEYSQQHANWLIKVSSSAKALDVINLVKIGQERVKDHYGIVLQPEIKFW